MARTRSDPGEERITVTEAVRRFSDVVNQARYEGKRFTLTRGGKPVAEIGPPGGLTSTAAAFAAAWRKRRRLGRGEAEAFARDVARARKRVGRPREPDWD